MRSRIGAIIAAAVAALCLSGTPAHAAAQVAEHSSRVEVGTDGGLRVRTVIRNNDSTGPDEIVQKVRLRAELPGQRERVMTLEAASITSDGKPGQVTLGDDEAVFRAPAGPQSQIVIDYRVRGAAARTSTNLTTIRWNTLQGLNADVRRVRGTLALPGQFTDFGCVAGAPGTDHNCTAAESSPDIPEPRFSDGPRGAGEIVGFQLAFDSGLVAADERVEERWTVGRAFSAAPLPLGVALGVGLLGALGLWLLHRRGGRDAAAGASDHALARFVETPGGTVFSVGESVAPGQIGTLADERVDPIDVTATILDLAVNGHLRITELPRESAYAPAEWTLTRRADATGRPLRAYEVALLDALVPVGAEPVRVSTLAARLDGRMDTVQEALYDEMVAQGWYERRPDATRGRWNGLAIGAVIAAVFVTGVLAAFTHFGLTGVMLVALALGLAFIAQEMPARTPAGATMLQRLAGLRAELLGRPTHGFAADRAYREISQVLPYAVVLGGAERWLDALVAADDDEDADPEDLDWYHAPTDWHLRDLPDSLQNFITTVSGRLFAR